MFGRPPRATGHLAERSAKATDAQRLHLLNSTHIQRKIEKSWKLRALVQRQRGKGGKGGKGGGKGPGGIVRAIYVAVLSRPPTPDELRVALEYSRSSGAKGKQASDDLVWALVNTKEFLYHH